MRCVAGSEQFNFMIVAKKGLVIVTFKVLRTFVRWQCSQIICLVLSQSHSGICSAEHLLHHVNVHYISYNFHYLYRYKVDECSCKPSDSATDCMCHLTKEQYQPGF